MKKVSLNLGSGIYVRKGFINVDKAYTLEELKSKKGAFKNAIVEKGGEYIQADILHLPFKDNYADYVELLNTIEHFPMRQVIDYMKEIYRVMKPKAKLIILTNNMDGLAVDWLQMASRPPFNLKEYFEVAETIYGNQLGPGEFHCCPFTPAFLNYVLTSAGFKTGFIGILKKGSKTPTIGTIKPKKHSVCRNDLLYAEATK